MGCAGRSCHISSPTGKRCCKIGLARIMLVLHQSTIFGDQMQLIHSQKVPEPKGHYSHAVVSNGLMYVSGILPEPAHAGQENSFERQVRSVFTRGQLILEAGNSSLQQVVQCTAYIADVAHWAQFNEIYAEIFGQHKPARAVVPVAHLHYGFLVEVQLVAEVNKP